MEFEVCDLKLELWGSNCEEWSCGPWVSGLRFQVFGDGLNFWFQDWGFAFRVSGCRFEFRVLCFRCRVFDLGFGVWDLSDRF